MHSPLFGRAMRDKFIGKGISGAVLKWIAVITMIIDHYAIAVYWQMTGHNYETYNVLRKIGRIAFPIYCFLLVEGFFHTRNVRKYITNCFIFAVISEVPFDMAVFGRVIYPKGQNVYFTLALGLCALVLLDRLKYRYEIRFILARLAVIGVFAYMGQIFEVDYHWKGILFIIMFYYCYNIEKWKRNIIGICAFAYEITAPLAFIPIQLYNGKRGRQNKYLFYAIYPLHLLILGLIRFKLNGKI
jgi:hypothetical protein